MLYETSLLEINPDDQFQQVTSSSGHYKHYENAFKEFTETIENIINEHPEWQKVNNEILDQDDPMSSRQIAVFREIPAGNTTEAPKIIRRVVALKPYEIDDENED